MGLTQRSFGAASRWRSEVKDVSGPGGGVGGAGASIGASSLSVAVVYRSLRSTLLFLLAVIAVAACGSESQTSLSPAGSGQTAQPERQESFDQQRALTHVRQLAESIGPRPAGSEGEARAADYIKSQLSGYGYDVRLQPFEFESVSSEGSTLEIISPARQTLELLPLLGSISGLAEGVLVPAGIGRPQDFPVSVKSNIALISRGELEFGEKVANAAAAGAIGAVIHNNQPGAFLGDLRRTSNIPAVSIAQDHGERLLSLTTQDSVNVRLDLKLQTVTRSSQNVVARLGSAPCQVVIGGHYDSVPQGPGANDNASGTATVLEMARVWRANGGREDVCFVLFGAEEIGLVGSQAFAQNLSPDELNSIRGMINIDMISVGNEWVLSGTSALRTAAAQKAAERGFVYSEAEQTPGLGSDHASFLEAGIPAVMLHRREDPNYHTPQDQLQFVDPLLLSQAAEMGFGVLGALLTPE